MKTSILSMIAAAALGACGVADPESPARGGESTQELSFPVDVFYESFNNLNLGIIHGQNGWAGDCMVVPGVSRADRNLDCTGAAGLINGRGAQRTFYRPPGRDYHVQFWHDGGTEFRCGASVYPADPDETRFITIPALGDHGEQEYIGPFDRVRVLGGIGQRLGTTTYDKIQVLSN